MPTDPSIPLQARGPSFDPMEAYGRALSLRGMLQQGRIGDLQEQQLRAQLAAAPQVAAAEAAKRAAEGTKLSAETVKLELDNAAARTARAGELLQGATDEVGWQAAREGITQLLGPQAPSVLAFLGPTFDPARVKSALASVTKASDFIKQQQDQWARAHGEAQLAETGRHNLATEQGTASAAAATAARAAAAQAETGRHNLATESAAAAAAARAGQAQAETARHNRATEATAAARQGVTMQQAQRAAAAATEAMKVYGDDMLSVIDSLIDADGNLKPNAKGVIGGLQGMRPDWAYGSEDSQQALAGIDRLQSMLNIDTLRDMKAQSRTGASGFGALSEKELKVIESSASSLRKRRQSDAVYAAELKRIRKAITDARKTQGGGKIRARDHQGNLHEAEAGTALPAGWKLEP